jgi:hypothetical protein
MPPAVPTHHNEAGAPVINWAVCMGITALFVGIGLGIGIGALMFRLPYRRGHHRGVGIGVGFYGKKRRKRSAADVFEDDDEEFEKDLQHSNLMRAIDDARERYE